MRLVLLSIDSSRIAMLDGCSSRWKFLLQGTHIIYLYNVLVTASAPVLYADLHVRNSVILLAMILLHFIYF